MAVAGLHSQAGQAQLALRAPRGGQTRATRGSETRSAVSLHARRAKISARRTAPTRRLGPRPRSRPHPGDAAPEHGAPAVPPPSRQRSGAARRGSAHLQRRSALKRPALIEFVQQPSLSTRTLDVQTLLPGSPLLWLSHRVASDQRPRRSDAQSAAKLDTVLCYTAMHAKTWPDLRCKSRW